MERGGSLLLSDVNLRQVVWIIWLQSLCKWLLSYQKFVVDQLRCEYLATLSNNSFSDLNKVYEDERSAYLTCLTVEFSISRKRNEGEKERGS